MCQVLVRTSGISAVNKMKSLLSGSLLGVQGVCIAGGGGPQKVNKQTYRPSGDKCCEEKSSRVIHRLGLWGAIYLVWSWQVSDKVTFEDIHDGGDRRTHVEI